MIRLKTLNQAGDTIVEVMIVLAILGLSFAISYATANRGLQQSRNAEEHSEALGLLNSQVELVRAAYAAQQTLPSTYSFCIPNSSDPSTTTPLTSAGHNYTLPQPDSSDSDFANYPSGCVNSFYHVSITKRTPPTGTGTAYFDFMVRWDGLGNLGIQQEELTYRINSIAVTGGQGYTNSPPATSPQYSCNLSVPSLSGLSVNGVTLTYNASDGATFIGASPILWNAPSSTPSSPYSAGASYSHTYGLNGTYTISTTADFTVNGVNTPVTCSKQVTLSFSWSANGNAYASCVPDLPQEAGAANDGHNGCDPPADAAPNSTSMYARRGVDVTYNLATAGQAAGQQATLSVNLNQYQKAGTSPPPGYQFKLSVYINGSSVSIATIQTAVPNGAGAAPTSASVQIPVPISGIYTIKLDWVDNEVDQNGNPIPNVYDPDLQLNTIQLTQP